MFPTEEIEALLSTQMRGPAEDNFLTNTSTGEISMKSYPLSSLNFFFFFLFKFLKFYFWP